MSKIVKDLFSRYVCVGILNTLLHWSVFFLSYSFFCLGQSVSNLMGFLVSVIFSFFMNAKFTFRQNTSAPKFISYIIFMGGLSYVVGWIADYIKIDSIFTVSIFSILSLFLGFLYAHHVTFRTSNINNKFHNNSFDR